MVMNCGERIAGLGELVLEGVSLALMRCPYHGLMPCSVLFPELMSCAGSFSLPSAFCCTTTSFCSVYASLFSRAEYGSGMSLEQDFLTCLLLPGWSCTLRVEASLFSTTAECTGAPLQALILPLTSCLWNSTVAGRWMLSAHPIPSATPS